MHFLVAQMWLAEVKKRTYKVGTQFVLIEGLNRSFIAFFNLFAS